MRTVPSRRSTWAQPAEGRPWPSDYNDDDYNDSDDKKMMMISMIVMIKEDPTVCAACTTAATPAHNFYIFSFSMNMTTMIIIILTQCIVVIINIKVIHCTQGVRNKKVGSQCAAASSAAELEASAFMICLHTLD